MKYVSQTLSFLLHPLLMPTYGTAILLQHDMFIAGGLHWMVLFYIFFFSFLLPVLNILFLYYRKAITSLYLNDRRERFLPYLATLIVYVVAYFMIRNQLPAPSLSYAMLGGTLAIFVTIIANYFYKVSAHMIGIGGLTGALLFVSISSGYNTLPELIGLFFSAGILGSARLHLEAHSPFEIWTGYLLGFVPQVIFIWM